MGDRACYGKVFQRRKKGAMKNLKQIFTAECAEFAEKKKSFLEYFTARDAKYVKDKREVIFSV